MLLQSKNFITRTSLGWKKLKQGGLGGTTGLSCSTKQIIAALRARMAADGATLGAARCLSKYIETLVENTQEYCDYVKRRLYLESIYLPVDSTCSTVQIIPALRTRLGLPQETYLNCLSNQVNRLTGTSQAECYATALWLRLQAAGVVTGSSACITNQFKRLTDEPIVLEIAYCNTMNVNCDAIPYNTDAEWYNPII